MAERGTFDEAAFFTALNSVRVSRDLNWRQVATQIGISQSTLTRLAQGKRPDVDSLAALADWASLSVDDFVRRVHGPAADQDPMIAISTYLRASKDLSPEAAKALEKVINATYEALQEK